MPETTPIKITTKTEAEVVAELARQAAGAENVSKVHRIGADGTPFILVPQGDGSFAVRDMTDMLPQPTSIEENHIFSDVESFCSYVNEFKDDYTHIFAVSELNDVRFNAVLDYHMRDEAKTGEAKPKARHGEHICTYNFPMTPEWKEILGKNAAWLKQEEFAHMVERLVVNFKEPQGADMLELARSIEAKTEGEFKSSFRMENGERELIFNSRIDGQANVRGEKVMIPAKLVLWIQPFIRGPYFQLEALFRYRVNGGSVVFQYELVKPHEFIDLAVQAVKAQIVESTGIIPLFGKF